MVQNLSYLPPLMAVVFGVLAVAALNAFIAEVERTGAIRPHRDDMDDAMREPGRLPELARRRAGELFRALARRQEREGAERKRRVAVAAAVAAICSLAWSSFG